MTAGINYAKYFMPRRYYQIDHHRFEELVKDVFGVEFDYIEDQIAGQRFLVDEESHCDVYQVSDNPRIAYLITEDDIENFERWFYGVGYRWPITSTLLQFMANQNIIPYGHYLIKAY